METVSAYAAMTKAVFKVKTYKTMALARERWVYPAMLDEIVVRDTVKPTD